MNLYNESEIMGKDPVNEKIKKIYHRKKPNYKNIETFSIIPPSIWKNSALEGLETSNSMDKTGADAINKKQTKKCPGTDWNANYKPDDATAYISKINALEDEQYAKEKGAFLNGLHDIEDKANKYINKLDEIATEQYDKVYTELNAKYENVKNNIPTSMSDIKDKLKSSNKEDLNKSVQDQIAEAIFYINKVSKVFTTILNNLLMYVSLSIVRLAYEVLPEWPIDILKDRNDPNYPWNINFNVSSADNLTTGGNLYSESSPAIQLNGKDIAPSTYIQNQKIQSDTQILVNFFIQFILVLVSYLITANLFYNIEMETSVAKWFYDKPVGFTPAPQNRPMVEHGFHVIFSCIKNTAISTPYNVYFAIFFGIKWILQTLRIYEYKELTFILLFLIVLYLCIKYFWNYYNSFIENPITWSYEPIILLFVFYGIYENYLNVQLIKYGILHGGRHTPVTHHWISSSITVFILLSIFFVIFPFLRIVLTFWFIYLFIYNKWNGLNLDILSSEKTTNCGPKEGIFSGIQKIINKYIFPNFLFFVMLILVLFNVYNSFKNNKIYNKGIKHTMIGLSLLMLLGLVLYALYKFYNNNNSKPSDKVVYTPGHLSKSMADILKSDIDSKIKLDDYPPPVEPPKLETAEPPKQGSSFLLNTLKNSSLNPLNNPVLKSAEALTGIKTNNIIENLQDIGKGSMSDKIKNVIPKNITDSSDKMKNLGMNNLPNLSKENK